MGATTPVWALTLSRSELLLLAHSLGGAAPLGLQDPFQGLNEEAVQPVADAAKRSLMARGYADSGPDGALSVDPTVLALAGAPSQARCVLVASLSAAGAAAARRVVYLGRDLIVEQDEAPDDGVLLTAVRDGEALQQRLRRFLCIPNSPVAPGGEIVISQADLKEALLIAILEPPGSVAAHLSAQGIDSASAALLSAALGQELKAGSLAVVGGDGVDSDHAAGVAWLASPAGAWCAATEGETATNRIRLTPQAGRQIRRRLTNLVSTALTASAGDGRQE
jgi:hypothetical protein